MMTTKPSDKKDKNDRWNNEAHVALCVALVDALNAADSPATRHKTEITETMKSKGFDFTWEAVR
jgi:hypothetical protein